MSDECLLFLMLFSTMYFRFLIPDFLRAGNRHCEITFVVTSFEIVTYWEKLQKKK